MIPVILLATIVIAFVVTVFWAVKNGIGPMPTSSKQKRALLEALPETASGRIYELGSGWGNLAAMLARRYPDCRVTGVENSPLPFLISSLGYKLFTRIPNLEFQWANLKDVPLGDASLIVCYLYTGAVQKLEQKLDREIKPGTIVVTNTFSFHGWNADSVFESNDLYRSRIYRYRK